MQKVFYIFLFLMISNLSNAQHKKVKDKELEGKIFTRVEIDAEFIGGNKKFKEFFYNNLDTLIADKNKAPKGEYKVIVQYTIDIDGSIKNVKPLQDPGYGCFEECKRVLLLSPKWKPRIVNAKYVVAIKKQTITFIVE